MNKIKEDSDSCSASLLAGMVLMVIFQLVIFTFVGLILKAIGN